MEQDYHMLDGGADMNMESLKHGAILKSRLTHGPWHQDGAISETWLYVSISRAQTMVAVCQDILAINPACPGILVTNLVCQDTLVKSEPQKVRKSVCLESTN